MICHENRGTGPHYEDVARRFAKAGFVGLSLDLLSRQGGTPAVPANQVGGPSPGRERRSASSGTSRRLWRTCASSRSWTATALG